MNAQVQPAAASKEVSLSQEFEILRPEVTKVLPAHVTADRFLRVCATALAQTPGLKAAASTPTGRRSLLTSCVKCATDGLVPDGREAALVVFKNKDGAQVQYMPMVRGILKLVRNSGELKSLMANVVYEQDEFNYWVDDVGEHITHKPNITAESRGKLLAVYAIAETKDGGRYVEVMSRGQIEQVKAVSRSGNNGPWGPWYDEMSRKTVIRRLSKRLPMSTDLEQVIQRDDELYELKQERLTASGGNAAAKAVLGLPMLPDADDVAAAGAEDHGTEDVDTTTGEVRVKCDGNHGGPPCGDHECWAIEDEPPPREQGTPLPGFDEKKAVRLLRGSKTRAALDGAMAGIETLLHGAETPIAITAAFEEMTAKFESQIPADPEVKK